VFTRPRTKAKWRLVDAGSFTEIEKVDELIQSDRDIVLYEQLHVFHRTISTVGLEICGAIRLRAKQVGVEAIPREPSYLQGIRHWPITDERPKIKSKHARDAYLHALVYLQVNNVEGVKWNFAEAT